MLQAYRWTRQPQQSTQLDWSNELAQGLVFWFDPISMCDLATGISAVSLTKPTGYSRGPAVGHDGFGLVASGSQTADYEFVTRDPLSGVTGFTLAWLGTFTVLNNNGALFGKFSTSDTLSQTGIILGGAHTNYNFYIPNGAGTPHTRISTGATPVVATRTCVMATAVLASSSIIYVNGLNVSSTSTGTMPSALQACAKGWSISNNFAHTIPGGEVTLLCAAWNRALSAGEARAFNENPWQVLQPRIARGARVFSPLTADVGTFT